MNGKFVQVSFNGRHFTGSDGNPLFWLGDTQWNLFRCHIPEEAEAILVNRRDKGFTFLQVMLPGFRHQVERDAVCGEAFPTNDPFRPNLEYFGHVDAIMGLALKHGIALVIGIDHPVLNLVNIDNARDYGRWVGARYRRFPNVVWAASYYVPKGDKLLLTRELAYGLREGGGGAHLITCHPDPAHPVATSGVCHNEEWLDFNCIQTFRSIGLIGPAVTEDYMRMPPKPVVLAEGAYEDWPEYGFAVTPRLIRKQAYLSFFAGGHHSYGHNDNWRVSPAWKASLDSPGACQMAVFRKILTALRWWELAPDRQTGIAGSCGPDDVRLAMRTPSADCVIVYASSPEPFAMRLGGTAANSYAMEWIDPRDGTRADAIAVPQGDRAAFACPPGWQDALLLLTLK